jgi:multidrug resistance efflux pump
MKKLLPLLIVLGVGGGAYWYFNRPVTELQLTGIVTTNDVVVSPQIGGRIDKLLVNEGDSIKAGQLIAVISPDELRAESDYAMQNAQGLTSQIQGAEASVRYEEQQTEEQIRQAESNLAATEFQQASAAADMEQARLKLERQQNLAREGVAAAQDLDDARTKFESEQARVDALKRQADAQRAQVDIAKSNNEQIAMRRSQLQANQHAKAAAAAQQTKADVRLAYTEVRTPIDGIVDKSAVRIGEVVNAGQPVVTLINPDDLWVRADVEETYIDRVRIGDHIAVRLPSGQELDGVVFYRGLDAGFATQRDVSRTKRDIKTFEIRLKCDNKERRLAVGMTAFVMLSVK